MTTQDKIKNAKDFFEFADKDFFDDLFSIMKTGKFMEINIDDTKKDVFVRNMNIVEKALFTLYKQLENKCSAINLDLNHQKKKAEKYVKKDVDSDAEKIEYGRLIAMEIIFHKTSLHKDLAQKMIWHIVRSTLPIELTTYVVDVSIRRGFKVVLEVEEDLVDLYKDAVSDKEKYPIQESINFGQNYESAFFYYTKGSIFEKVLEVIHKKKFLDSTFDLPQNRGLVYDMNLAEKTLYTVSEYYGRIFRTKNEKKANLLNQIEVGLDKKEFIINNLDNSIAQEIVYLSKELIFLQTSVMILGLLLFNTVFSNKKEKYLNNLQHNIGFFKDHKLSIIGK